MAECQRGDLVWVPFPFSSEESYKLRPALVLASWPYFNGTDYLVCLVTTQQEEDPCSMPLSSDEMAEGKLSATCYLRPTYTFAVDGNFIKRRLGCLNTEKTRQVIAVLTKILNS